MSTPIQINVEAILKAKAPNKKVPAFIINYLKKIIHQEEINTFLAANNTQGLEFVDTIMEFLQAKATFYGLENLPNKNQKVIFVSNHPLGGLDGVILAGMLGKKVNPNIKVFVNDILMFLKPLNNLFVPINKTGNQNKRYAQQTHEVYASENNILTFPAGACSRKVNGKITDLEWKKTFVAKAIQHQRDIVPIYFEGRNSNFFYTLAKLRNLLGIKLNIEMLYLVNEMFKQRGSNFQVKIGKPIKWQTLDKTNTHTQWSNWIKQQVYELK